MTPLRRHRGPQCLTARRRSAASSREHVNRFPERRGAILRPQNGRFLVNHLLPKRSPSVRPLPVDREPPRRANDPRTKAVSISKAPKMAVGTDKRLLRNIFRIFSLSQDAERHAKWPAWRNPPIELRTRGGVRPPLPGGHLLPHPGAWHEPAADCAICGHYSASLTQFATGSPDSKAAGGHSGSLSAGFASVRTRVGRHRMRQAHACGEYRVTR